MDTVGELSSEDVSGDSSLLAGMRRLAALADRASEPQAIFRALAAELTQGLGAAEVHVHHLLRGQLQEHASAILGNQVSGEPQDLVTVYLFGGEGRLSYLSSSEQRPPGVSWVTSTGRSFAALSAPEQALSVPHLEAASGSAEDQVSRALLVPLAVHQEIEAVVIVVFRQSPDQDGNRGPGQDGNGKPRQNANELDRAATLVDQAATALALVHARAEAGTDPVTGCMNHRAMRRRLQEEIGRAHRTQGRLACMLFDLDDFKLVNDRHGHPAGDAVLRAVAQALMGEFRAFDRIARYGGDEFVAILPEADLASASAAAGRALQRLRSISLTATPQGVSASIGVAQWTAPMTLDDLLERCDEALLRGKREGKGRVSEGGGSVSATLRGHAPEQQL